MIRVTLTDTERAALQAARRDRTFSPPERDRIKAITAPRYRLREPVQTLVDELNRLSRGWGAYFRVGNASGQFQEVDDYVRERLALFLSQKTGRRGRQWGRHSVTLFRALGVYQLCQPPILPP